MTFGERLKHFRKLKKMTQTDVADAIGVKKSTIAGYESGNRAPDVAKIKKIAAALGVSADELIGTEIKKEPTVKMDDKLKKIIELYPYAPEEIQDLIMTVLESSEARQQSPGDDVKDM